MSKPSLVIVVVEDDRHRMLLYRYLLNQGMRPHSIRIERSPAGSGSAENWVRKTYVKEVNVYRRRHAETALIVVIDADIHAVPDRLRQLNDALNGSGKQSIDNSERIARLVPKRNIETWILCLNNQAVDEASDYKTSGDWNNLIQQAARELFEWARSHPPQHCVDSLRSGIKELKRLRL